MRSVIIVLLAAFAVNALDIHEDYMNELDEIHEFCMNESKCDKEMLRRHYLERNVDDPKLRNYLMCASKKMGYRNDAGEYQQEVHRKSLMKIVKDEGKVDEMMKKCVIKKDTPDESVLMSARCFTEELSRFLTKRHDEKLKKFTKECMNESGVSDDDMKALHEGRESGDEKIKDYSMCMMKRFGSMTEGGELNMNVIKARLYFILHSRDRVREMTDKCCKKMDSPKETAYRYVLCKFQNLK